MASVLMIAASSALFVYWFRCTCLLLLAQKQSPEYALKVASTVRLNFQVQEELEAQPDQLDLDRLYAGLEDDYRMLTDLLRQVTGSESIDQKLLMTGLQGDAGLVQAGARSGPWSVPPPSHAPRCQPYSAISPQSSATTLPPDRHPWQPKKR